MVDSEAAAVMLGCKAQSVEKYMEIMRHLRYIPKQFREIPERYGFVSCTSRMPTDICRILGVEHLHDPNVEEEPYPEVSDEALILLWAQDESKFELPHLNVADEEQIHFF